MHVEKALPHLDFSPTNEEVQPSLRKSKIVYILEDLKPTRSGVDYKPLQFSPLS